MTAQDRPLTPGSVWRSRGTAGHDRYEVRILKLTAAGRVTFCRVAHRRGLGERRNTATEPQFRRQYEPVKVEPVSEAQVAAHQLDALRFQERQHRLQAARTNGALLDRLAVDPEDLIHPAPSDAVPEPVPIPPAPEEAEAFSPGEPPAPEPPHDVPVLDAYLDAGLAALALLDVQLRAKDEALAALAAEKDVLVAQRAAIAASLETLSQQAPITPVAKS